LRVVHAGERLQVAANVDHRDLHLPAFLLGLGDAGLEDLARDIEGQDRPHFERRRRHCEECQKPADKGRAYEFAHVSLPAIRFLDVDLSTIILGHDQKSAARDIRPARVRPDRRLCACR